MNWQYHFEFYLLLPPHIFPRYPENIKNLNVKDTPINDGNMTQDMASSGPEPQGAYGQCVFYSVSVTGEPPYNTNAPRFDPRFFPRSDMLEKNELGVMESGCLSSFETTPTWMRILKYCGSFLFFYCFFKV